MSERKLLLGNTLFASVGIYVEYFLGMLTSILLARYLGPSDFGIYGLIMWLAGLGIALTNAGITTGMIKFVAELRGNKAKVELAEGVVATCNIKAKQEEPRANVGRAADVSALSAMLAARWKQGPASNSGSEGIREGQLCQ